MNAYHECIVCNCKLDSRKSLLRHSLWKHQLIVEVNQDDYSDLLDCHICGNRQSFDNTTEVIRHLRNFHGFLNNEVNGNNVASSNRENPTILSRRINVEGHHLANERLKSIQFSLSPSQHNTPGLGNCLVEAISDQLR